MSCFFVDEAASVVACDDASSVVYDYTNDHFSIEGLQVGKRGCAGPPRGNAYRRCLGSSGSIRCRRRRWRRVLHGLATKGSSTGGQLLLPQVVHP